MPQCGQANSASLHQGEAKRAPWPNTWKYSSCFLSLSDLRRTEASFLRNLIRDIVDDGLMSEGDDERRGGGGDSLVREWISTYGDMNEHTDVSETSTLLPTSRGPSSLAVQPWPRHGEDGPGEQRQEEEEQQPNSSRRMGHILNCEGLLRVGLLVVMLAMVGLAIVRALKGKFSPGLVAGGGFMMVMCILVNKRELRGRLVSD
ncbi:hypothetical protein M431DRAFT_493501 [Trichoderma harzianum CBS 226.95]|uniref:Uncharacterized protein n=1 Tax=Trichoderma harzianum CBS 226.95 TaxID=983964 RepID=A0A2T4AIY4_TRIHA|nr:hypothetical protein M431DRAFT_493501 [Trichoderma harzianum CBS 226.95]PTB57026.1 hypothetical protein M431DRAFT_493501 [Trichoderma harzianum CBS 226.95]